MQSTVTIARPTKGHLFARSKKRVQNKQLDSELAELYARYDGLVGDIVRSGIDYAELLEIRNTFYKRIRQAPLKKYADPVAKLELYKRLTKSFHDRFLAERVIFAGHEEIRNLREVDETIARITSRLIDLSNSEKNDFVRTMKRVREIRQLYR